MVGWEVVESGKHRNSTCVADVRRESFAMHIQLPEGWGPERRVRRLYFVVGGGGDVLIACVQES